MLTAPAAILRSLCSLLCARLSSSRVLHSAIYIKNIENANAMICVIGRVWLLPTKNRNFCFLCLKYAFDLRPIICEFHPLHVTKQWLVGLLLFSFKNTVWNTFRIYKQHFSMNPVSHIQFRLSHLRNFYHFDAIESHYIGQFLSYTQTKQFRFQLFVRIIRCSRIYCTNLFYKCQRFEIGYSTFREIIL